jgi:hypothetical protein
VCPPPGGVCGRGPSWPRHSPWSPVRPSRWPGPTASRSPQRWAPGCGRRPRASGCGAHRAAGPGCRQWPSGRSGGGRCASAGSRRAGPATGSRSTARTRSRPPARGGWWRGGLAGQGQSAGWAAAGQADTIGVGQVGWEPSRWTRWVLSWGGGHRVLVRGRGAAGRWWVACYGHVRHRR